MTFAIALELLMKYGPSAVMMGEKLIADITAGKANETVTPEDWAELKRLGSQAGEDIYARLGIEPPPKNEAAARTGA